MTAPGPSAASLAPVAGVVPPADLAGPPPGLGDLTAAPAVGVLAAGAAAPTPAPTPAPTGGFESWEVSPGLLGFIPVFLIALACVGLFLSLTRQMRRVGVRQAQRDAEDAEALRRDGSPDGDGPADGAPGAR